MNRLMELCTRLSYGGSHNCRIAERIRVAAEDLAILPEGVVWPKFEDGEPVCPGDSFMDSNGGARIARSFYLHEHNAQVSDNDCHFAFYSPDKPIKRPDFDTGK